MTFSVSQANESALKMRKRLDKQRIAAVKRRATMMDLEQRYGGTAHTDRIRMVVSPWFRDENGIPTRTVTAI
jgi:hypothetical protein